MEEYKTIVNALIDNIEKVIVGKRDSVKLLIVGLLTNGHILIEDVPGTGKTTLALAVAKSIGGVFKRIQFTPDLLPSDVTGGFIYNPKTGEFELKKGPIFANIVLADEVNRTSPRTQSSLLECMQEYKVTLDGQTLALDKPFMVIATQNPIEFQGTYPLPETQIDRFLMKIEMGYLEVEQEVQVLNAQEKNHPLETIQQVSSLAQVKEMQEKVKEIEISEKVLTYIARLISSTRTAANITLGASTRASIALMNSARVWALLEGRNYVIPDDVYYLSYWVLRHRVLIDPKAAMEGTSVKDIISDLLDQTVIS